MDDDYVDDDDEMSPADMREAKRKISMTERGVTRTWDQRIRDIIDILEISIDILQILIDILEILLIY